MITLFLSIVGWCTDNMKEIMSSESQLTFESHYSKIFGRLYSRSSSLFTAAKLALVAH